MTKVRINRSELIDGKVIVSWSDGVEFEYALNGTLQSAGSYDAKRMAVSETSARCTIEGVDVKS